MAVVGTSSAYLSGSPGVSAYPCTILCYVRVPFTTNNRFPVRLFTDANNEMRIQIQDSTNQVRGLNIISGSGVAADSGVNASVDTWYPAAYTMTSATDRTIHAWDAIGGTRTSVQNTTSRAFTGSSIHIAVGSVSPHTVLVQDVAILDVALNTTQLDEWAAGKTALACSFVGDLVAYQPLVSGINETGSIGTVSEVGSPTYTTGPTLTGPSSSAVSIAIQRLYR